MIRTGILNPELAAMLCRFRHTNSIVITDREFPFWPEVETVDISLMDGIPTVRDVLVAITTTCQFGGAWMAEEFRENNPAEIVAERCELLGKTPLVFETHVSFKKRVSQAVGLIRTGDAIPYANIILESA